MPEAYFRWPSLHQNKVVFGCEDDLWQIDLKGGPATRLTANLGSISTPQISPDGQYIAFTGTDEGHPEVYVMPAEGGPARRLSYFGTTVTRVVGWSQDSQQVICSSSAQQPMRRRVELFALDLSGGEAQPLGYGMAHHISFGPDQRCVIGRHSWDGARWKRYKGGTKGMAWVDADGNGEFQVLIELDGQMSSPIWHQDRIYFVSDHEGSGNLYSCQPNGQDLKRHSDHEDYYVRFPSAHNGHIVYQCGGALYHYEIATDSSQKIQVDWHSPQVQRNRKFVSAGKYLNQVHLHPEGHSLSLITRGKPFIAPAFAGAVKQYGERQGVRYRTSHFLSDNQRLVMTGDPGGEELVEVHHLDGSKPPVRIEDKALGRPDHVAVSPTTPQIAVVNHRRQLLLVDVDTQSTQVLDSCDQHEGIGMPAWSPDGQWIAYRYCVQPGVSIIRLYHVEDGSAHDVTTPVMEDYAPCFDPEGKYLYFLSSREFNPAYDSMHFSLGFPFGSRPYLVTLQADLRSPFEPDASMVIDSQSKDESGDADTQDAANTEENKEGENEKDKVKPVQIDLEGIEQRIVAFPVKDGRYRKIQAVAGKVFYSSYPVYGSLDNQWNENAKVRASIKAYDLKKREGEHWLDGVSDFQVASKGDKMAVWGDGKLRLISTGEKPSEKMLSDSKPGLKSGLFDFGRIRLEVVPALEWKQMYYDSWRRMRDHFWTENMSGVDWEEVRDRYAPLLDKIASRSEYADLMWEVQGELGTSHAYEMGGDYRPEPRYKQGHLGAEFVWDAKQKGYRITHIVKGDHWDGKLGGPLCRPGLNIAIGDVLTAINGQELSPEFTPGQALLHQCQQDVLLKFAAREGEDTARTVQVRTSANDAPARYRDWVEHNRKTVHERSNGQIGYVHIPDMGPHGFAEFHRYYLAECNYPALLVDVRFNGGGHVSQLLLDKLSRKRLGYDIPRWGQPESYPSYAVLGPILTLTDENAGSDGDIFSHAFKMLKLGKLVGKRTWGGVIGINSQGRLVDGSVTTQPEFSFWFHDVGWGVENYGTDPDIEVDYAPHHYKRGEDPQLERAMAELEQMLKDNPPQVPDFSQRPNLKRPTLPPR